MKFETLNTSIVVLAEAHNPSILHPSFLSSLGIVPNDWQLAEPPVCTPLISVVKYANTVVFKAEPNKLMVLSESVPGGLLLQQITAAYVKALPHVHFLAVGTNIAGYIDCPDRPEAWIVKRFLKEGPGNDQKLAPRTAAIKLIYELEKGTLTLSCEAGSLRRGNETVDHPCLIVGGNVHIQVSAGNRLEETLSAIDLHSVNIAKFMETVQVVFEREQ